MFLKQAVFRKIKYQDIEYIVKFVKVSDLLSMNGDMLFYDKFHII